MAMETTHWEYREALTDRSRIEGLIEKKIDEVRLVGREHPKMRDLTARLDGYLTGMLHASKLYRSDSDAIASLGEALRMMSRLMRAFVIAAGDAAHDTHLATLDASMRSLAATIEGEKLPTQRTVREPGRGTKCIHGCARDAEYVTIMHTTTHGSNGIEIADSRIVAPPECSTCRDARHAQTKELIDRYTAADKQLRRLEALR